MRAKNKLIVLLALSMWSAGSQAATCYRSKAPVAVHGVQGTSTVSLLWNENGDGVDELRVDGHRVKVSADLFCTDAPPIGCTLGGDSGTIRLLFTENRLKIVTQGGVLRVARGDGAELQLDVQKVATTRVIELEALSAFDCQQAFPEPRIIEVFPSSGTGPLVPHSNITR